MKDIRAAYQVADLFSNTAVSPMDPNPPYRWIPEMLDRPSPHEVAPAPRPVFSPGPIAEMGAEGAPALRRRSRRASPTTATATSSTTSRCCYPTTIFMDLMGLPRRGRRPVPGLGERHPPRRPRPRGPGAPIQAMMAVTAYFAELIEERRKDPARTFVSSALNWKIDGEPIPEERPAVDVPAHVHGRSRHGRRPSSPTLLAPGHARRGPAAHRGRPDDHPDARSRSSCATTLRAAGPQGHCRTSSSTAAR